MSIGQDSPARYLKLLRAIVRAWPQNAGGAAVLDAAELADQDVVSEKWNRE